MNNRADIEITVVKDIAAPVANVFSAWTDANFLSRWFVPKKTMQVQRAEVDLRIGGEYLLHIHDPEEGTDHIVSGVYREIVENKKLVFDWMWKDGVERTEVTLVFESLGERKTRLVLTHTKFGQKLFAEKHLAGWEACLANLEHFSVTT